MARLADRYVHRRLAQITGTCDTGWGWGAKFLDYDNDGRLDLFVANGFISAGPEELQPDRAGMAARADQADRMRDVMDASHLAGHRQPLRSAATSATIYFATSASFSSPRWAPGFASTPRATAGAWRLPTSTETGRWILLVTNASGRPLLYRNEAGTRGNWLALALTGTESNRDAIGARVTLRTRDGTQIREVDGGNGYAAQSSRQVHFGLRSRRAADTIEIRWPSGTVQRLERVRANQTLRITEAASAASR